MTAKPDSPGEAVPAPATPVIDVEQMRGNLHATFNGGWQEPETIRAFHHGMDTVCNVLERYFNGEQTNGILPDSPAPVHGECICADGEIALLNTPDPCCPAREHRQAAYVAAPVHGEPPLTTYMATNNRATRQAAFLRTYAARVRDRTATSEDIAKSLEESQVEGGSLPNSRIRQAGSPLGGSVFGSLPSSSSVSVDLLRAAEAEISDYERSFELYHKASMALMRAYKRAHPNVPDGVWPDTGKVNEWTEAEIAALYAYRDRNIALGLELGQILGPEYDGTDLRTVAKEFVAMKAVPR